MNQANNKFKAWDLRKQEEPQLLGSLTQLKHELVPLRTAKNSSSSQVKLARIRTVRKAIARILTVTNEKRRDAARDKYEKSSRKPRDLRRKLTKAKRLQLTKSQQKRVTLRVAKKSGNFKPRKYALAQ